MDDACTDLVSKVGGHACNKISVERADVFKSREGTMRHIVNNPLTIRS
jgi:hypothetical protein